MKVTTDACLFGSWVASQMNKKQTLKVLDIGTGTGLLAMMFAQKKTDSFIDAVEVDHDAFKQAQENTANSPWGKRINIINADIKVFKPNQEYDIIVCNPPFYENELKSEKQNRNIAHHSEELTLADVLKMIHQHLKENGLFYLLLPYKRYKEIRKVIGDNEFFLSSTILVKQSVNHDYFRVMIEGRKKSSETEEIVLEEISIWDDQQQYTGEFISLLKDYYFNL